MIRILLAGALLLVLGGCAGLPQPAEAVADESLDAGPELSAVDLSPWAAHSGAGHAEGPKASTPTWAHLQFPGKRSTEYQPEDMEGRASLRASSDRSASMIRRQVRVEPSDLGVIRFSWRVPALIGEADMSVSEVEDAPVRVVLAFDGDRSKFSPRNAMLSELAHALTGEPMPYATLMYVWCNRRAAGEVIVNPRTDRIRKLVLESGPRKLDRWLDYERDVRADFERVFGEAPGALLAVGVMTDTDNTRSQTVAWYGPIQWASQGAANPAQRRPARLGSLNHR